MNPLALLLLLPIFAIELWFVLQSRSQAYKDYTADLESIVKRQQQDLIKRAEHGQFPDWSGYQLEIDRLFDNVDEQLRVWASAALAAGMGGTIFALIVHFSQDFGSDHAIGPEVILKTLPLALFGSLAGVVASLWITVWLLPRAEAQFKKQSEPFLESLRETSEDHQPIETLMKSIERIPTTLAPLLESSISTALTNLPQAVNSLVNVVENLGQQMDITLQSLQQNSKWVAESSAELSPGVERLSELVDRLHDFPHALAKVLAKERDFWAVDLKQSHDARWQQLEDLIIKMESRSNDREQSLLNRVAELNKAAASLAEQLGEQVVVLADRLGSRFGTQALDHVAQLKAELEKYWNRVVARIEGHEQKWRNNIGEVIRGVQEEAIRPIREELVPRLVLVSDTLENGSAKITDVVTEFTAAHREWKTTQEEALHGWHKASEGIERAAESLGEGDGQLNRAANAIAQRAASLEELMGREEELSSQLRAALVTVTQQHLAGWEPLRKEASRLIDDLHKEHLEIRRIISELAKVLGELIEGALNTAV